MSSHLILFATAAAEPGEKVSGVTKLLFDFGIDLPLLLAQILCFSVVMYLLWRFVFKPVLATLDDRQRQIESGLTYAEEMKAKLAQTKDESAAILKQAQTDGARLIEESRRAAKEFLDQQQKDAAARANDLVAKAKQAMELEHKKMLDETRSEVARLVVATTRQVLARELSDGERTRYNEAAVREISGG
jgi:F-type H+-transporting ATPase subunit b